MDTAILLEALAGHDALDPASATAAVDDYTRKLQAPTRALRLGRVLRPYFEDLDPDIESAVSAAIDVLGTLTAGLRDVELPYNNLLMTIASAEAYAYHYPHFSQTPERYQAMTRQRLAHSASITSADYIRALREMNELRVRADEAFTSVDLIVTPTTAISPIDISAGDADPPLPANGTPLEFRNTHMYDVLGLPAISIPCGFTRDGMPIGLQIAGPRFQESRVLALAHAYQQVTDWHLRHPPLG
jgi:aspartyl-tRNA(Asn)/glutamyl-tRNA(Gln) amidotransferase subunit A